ncbi:MAG: methyltransferase family protein [Candidatus Thorarchaeota archaeon]
MSILWLIRFSFIGCLFILIAIFAYFLKNREIYSGILENTTINIISVILFNTFCYMPIIIPSDESNIQKPTLLNQTLIVRWFDILGLILIILGILLIIRTILMRRSIGAQDTAGKLLTNGIYSFCRHPIYLGIIIISLGFGLRPINIEGLILFPFILLGNFTQAKLEELYDVGIRFREEYSNYKKQTRMFGPSWFWSILSIALIFPLVFFLII